MHRFAATALLAAFLLSGTPARAESFNGSILVPDFGTPAIARLLYSEAGQNGTIGYVFRLVGKSSFSLVTTGGATGLESFDIFFYDDAGGRPGTVLNPAYNSCPNGAPTCNKSGAIPAGARWGIITLVLGANGTFRYTAA